MGGGGLSGADTTFRRAGPGPGFDGRVEPYWHAFRTVQGGLGFLGRWRERGRVKAVLRQVRTGIVGQKGNAGDWDRSGGERACNLRVARMGLVRELKTWLKNATEGAAERRWPHLHVLRDRPCLIVPPRFAAPLSVAPSRQDEPLPVASAACLKEELGAVNGEFRIDETFAIKKMVDFMDATAKDIAGFEAKFGRQDGFWPKFSYVLIRKLAETSLERNLPAFIA